MGLFFIVITFEGTILLKVGLIILVIACLAMLLGLLYVSFKILRETQKKEALLKKDQTTQYQIHPKLKAELDAKKKNEE